MAIFIIIFNQVILYSLIFIVFAIYCDLLIKIKKKKTLI